MFNNFVYHLPALLAGGRSTDSLLRKGRGTVYFGARGGINTKINKSRILVKCSSVRTHGTHLCVSTSHLGQVKHKQIFQEVQPLAFFNRKDLKPQFQAPINRSMHKSKRKSRGKNFCPFLYSTTLMIRFLHQIV